MYYFFPTTVFSHHRMGSFNSAPKINNIDSQDDALEMPNGLASAADLVNHCKLMRGDNRPELLQRSFFKPIGDTTGADLTDGMRYLQLNSVSKGSYCAIFQYLTLGEQMKNIRKQRNTRQKPSSHGIYFYSGYFKMLNIHNYNLLLFFFAFLVSAVCSPPKSSPNKLRIFQWNILSQCT